MTALLILTYLSVVICVVFLLARVIRIASAPVHLRWELYPVPHEKGRASYGGSRLEEVNWWEKEDEKDHLGELKVMIPEIVFLKGVWEHNKELWTGSFPFHFGLYVLITNEVLLLLSAIMTVSGVPVYSSSEGFEGILYIIMNVLIWGGASIGLLGSIRIFFSRVVDKGLRNYSTASHYFNILLIGAIYATALIWIITDPNCVNELVAFYSALITFNTNIPEIALIGKIHIYTTLVFLAYFPFTHMTHMITKYFTYHKIRWEDAPNTPGNGMQKKIMEYLNQPVTWAAPHIGADGHKTWLTIASELPKKENENEQK